jgi:hypothetical protein
MMLSLIANVRLNGLQQGRTHAERSIPFLPLKLHAVFPEPARGVSLQLLDRLSQSQRRRQPDEEVDMVRRAAGSENVEPQVISNTDQVSVKPLLQFSGNHVMAVFCAEDAVNEICSMSV